MKRLRAWLMACGLVLLSSPLFGQYTLKYSTNGSVVTLTGYTGVPLSLTVPNFVNVIGSEAFFNCGTVDSVTIPSSVTNIGAEAFYDCHYLTNITISNGLVSIGAEAFASCSGLTNVTIPSTVTNIGYSPFCGSSTLNAIDVAAGNPAYMSVAGVLFNRSGTSLIEFPEAGQPATYTIPNTVTDVGQNAFMYCSALTKVTIPNSVTSIDAGCFQGAGLTSVTIPNSVTNLGQSAFNSCGSLTNLVIGSGLTAIGANAFESCNGLTKVTIPSSVTNLGATAFAFCNALTNVTIPNSVTTIGASCFQGNVLTSLTIPNSVTSIGFQSFCDSYSLTSVTIPESLTNIGSSAFIDSPSLTSVLFVGNGRNSNDCSVFEYGPTTIYYLPGASGFGSTYGCCPAVVWNPTITATNGSLGVRNHEFGFTITGTTNIPIQICATTNLSTGTWTPLQTCTLTNGSIPFSDPGSSNNPNRFYTVQFP